MATSSLINFTVPIGSTGASPSTQGLLMPKLKYRFRLTFVGFGVSVDTTELTRQVMDFKRPSAKFEDQVIDIYNSKVHYAGKVAWDPTSVNLRDDAQGQIASLVGEQLQKQFDFAQQASAASGIDYKFTLISEILDGGNGSSDPVTLETWTLYGCYLNSVDYEGLDYKASDPVTIALSITFDNAIQTPAGVGTPVTRTFGSVAI